MRTWLVNIRKAANMSQYAVADAAGMSQSYYASIETGVRGKPLSVTFAKKIAAVLDFDWTRFYEDSEQLIPGGPRGGKLMNLAAARKRRVCFSVKWPKL